MPDQSHDISLTLWEGRTLTGWNEIREALIFLDTIPDEMRNGARVEAYEYSKEFSVKVHHDLFLLVLDMKQGEAAKKDLKAIGVSEEQTKRVWNSIIGED